MSDLNNTQAAIGNFLDKVDAVRGLIIDKLNNSELGTTPTGTAGLLGAILQIDAALSKYNGSEKTPEDFGRLAAELMSNTPGQVGIYFGVLLFVYDLSRNYNFGGELYDWMHPEIDPKTKIDAAARYTAPIRRDPLTLDLDGDGLETVGTSAGILFDQTGSGVKQGTGWVKADDGFLVLDRNGNGVIDSGRELFGDSTIKSNGQTALDGFDALADLDSNADGKITSADTQFNSLRVWRDLNQDGISQTAELATLASLDITGINVASTEHSQVLANGNQIADLGTYTRTDGSTGTTAEVSGTLGDIDLAADLFRRPAGKLDLYRRL